MIEERENGVAIDNQTFALAGMRHIGELVRRNVEKYSENRAVAWGLVQQKNEVAVFKDILGLLRVGRSFTFCVIAVGMPPHLRKRFQISAL